MLLVFQGAGFYDYRASNGSDAGSLRNSQHSLNGDFFGDGRADAATFDRRERGPRFDDDLDRYRADEIHKCLWLCLWVYVSNLIENIGIVILCLTMCSSSSPRFLCIRIVNLWTIMTWKDWVQRWADSDAGHVARPLFGGSSSSSDHPPAARLPVWSAGKHVDVCLEMGLWKLELGLSLIDSDGCSWLLYYVETTWAYQILFLVILLCVLLVGNIFYFQQRGVSSQTYAQPRNNYHAADARNVNFSRLALLLREREEEREEEKEERGGEERDYIVGDFFYDFSSRGSEDSRVTEETVRRRVPSQRNEPPRNDRRPPENFYHQVLLFSLSWKSFFEDVLLFFDFTYSFTA